MAARSRSVGRAERRPRGSAAAERRLRDLLEATSDLVFFLDLEGRILEVNARGEACCGARAAELRGRPLAELAAEAHAAPLAELLAQCAQGSPEPRALEVDLQPGEGRPLPVHLVACATVAGKRALGIQVIARDLRERRRLAEALGDARRLGALARLARGLVHDLGNQLTVATHYAELVSARLGPAHPARADLEQILGAGQGAAALVRQLLGVEGRAAGMGIGAGAALRALSADLERGGARVRVRSESEGTRWEIYVPSAGEG